MLDVPQNLDTILHIGVGQCEELSAYLASDAKKIVLVEPNPKLASQLRWTTQSEPRVQVMELAFTTDPNLNTLYIYNLPEASSLYQPTGLRQLFPGLRTLAQHTVATITPEELLKQQPLEWDYNLLVLQAPGAEIAIIQSVANAKKLDKLSHIWLTNPQTAFYEGSSLAEDTLAELKRHGYDVKNEDDTNPDWPQWQLECNPMVRKVQVLQGEKEALIKSAQQLEDELKKIQSSRSELEQELNRALEAKQALEQKNLDQAKQLEEASHKTAELTKQLEVAQAESKQANQSKNQQAAEQNAKQQLEAKQQELNDANAKRAQAEMRTEDLSAKLKQLEARLAAEQGGQKQLDELKKKMEYLFDQQGLQLEQAANALGRHVINTAQNTAQELEAGFQLQQQLGSDFASLAERGNRLPSTVALQLSRQLKNQPYDLVIEMGSGVTTSFLAHTLRKRAESQSEDKSESTSVARYVEPSEDDLPKRLICFEHNRATVKSLQNTLKQSGLGPVISLQYAPLVGCQHQGREYLYYGFGNRMRQLAQLYENRTARIFILLNDVASDSRPDHIAALPQLLQYLSAHSLDIVVNTVHADANLINHWHQLLDARGLEYQPATEFGHQSVQLIQVNL